MLQDRVKGLELYNFDFHNKITQLKVYSYSVYKKRNPSIMFKEYIDLSLFDDTVIKKHNT